MTQTEEIDQFLANSIPVLDVRSPCEYDQGHIPQAVSFPLFTDAERSQVGLIYKQYGKDAAVKSGLNMVGPKLASFIEQAEQISPDRRMRIYCWRGGMRSSSVAWLLQTAGFQTTLLKDGYKAYRRWALEQFKKHYDFRVLGGLTGSGKTDHLHELARQGEQIIDLEELAGHKGSSFGHLGNPQQPSTEQFENMLAYRLSKQNINLPIWIEDESRMIGRCHLPSEIWDQMSRSLFSWIDCPKQDRIKRLLNSYGNHALEEMIEATQRLIRKLGSLRTKQAIQSIVERDLEKAISIILEYYDQAYLHSFKRRNRLEKG